MRMAGDSTKRYHLEGAGESESAAALAALPGPAPILEKIALKGFGGHVRFYVEISAGGRLYAVDRNGSGPPPV
jgi:hypothetical protein